jgi:hypothetical protein
MAFHGRAGPYGGFSFFLVQKRKGVQIELRAKTMLHGMEIGWLEFVVCGCDVVDAIICV